MTPRRTEYKRMLESGTELWCADFGKSLLTSKPEIITRISKRYIYTASGHSGSRAIYFTEDECWQSIKRKLIGKVSDLDDILALNDRLIQIKEDMPHLFL